MYGILIHVIGSHGGHKLIITVRRYGYDCEGQIHKKERRKNVQVDMAKSGYLLPYF